MIDFIKQVFASALGFLVVIAISIFFIFILIVATSSDPEPTVKENSVLYIKTSGVIPERVSQDPFEQFFSSSHPASASLQNFENNLRKAAADDNIEGVLIEFDFITAPWPTLQHMRRSIERFREQSGKFVYATTNDLGINEQGYYLASAADSIFAPQHTLMQMDGFVIEGTFFKSMLDKIGVEATVIHRGAYKSAGDSFQRTSFSDADREQLTAIFNDIVDEFEEAIASRTGMDRTEVTKMMNQPPRLDVEHYAERGLIDAIISQKELHDRIKRHIGVDEEDDLRLVNNGTYARVSNRSAGLPRPSSDAIAVIYASGPIMPMVDEGGLPFGGETTITVNNFNRSLEDALDDNNVKAIVVRIDSPGGSGSTSDAIWKLLREASKHKPVITSMGSVAASGGYYIAMAGDAVVADRTTITGSIGVIGISINAQELLTDKIGLDTDEIRFHDNANWLSPTRPLTSEQRNAFELFIDNFYDVFVNRVAESRGMTYDEVHAVAQGRVWSGEDAYEAGLTDYIGGLDTAIEIAAERAELESWSIREFPRERSFLERLASMPETTVRRIAGNTIPEYDKIEMVRYVTSGSQRPQAWTVMPYMIEVK